MLASSPTIRRVLRQHRQLVLDLSDSANLYLTRTQGRWFEAVLGDCCYRVSVSEPLTQASGALPYLLQSLFPDRARTELTVVDCGPATTNESVRNLHALSSAADISHYVAVDVNARLLAKVASGVRAELNLPVTTICRRFEDLDGLALKQSGHGKLLMIFGSTGMNYGSTEFVRLIRRICPSGGLLSFESLIRDGGLSKVPAYESDAVVRFAFGPLWLLGASRDDFDFRLVTGRDRLRLEFVARRGVSLSRDTVPRLRSGDRVWTAFSRRPTLLEHQAQVRRLAVRFESVVFGNQVVASLLEID